MSRLELAFAIRARTTDTQKDIFFENPKLLGFGRQIWQKIFGAFGGFQADLSVPSLVLWVPCSCFSLINHHFYKTLSPYILIPKIYLGVWTGKNEKFSHRVSVVRASEYQSYIGKVCPEKKQTGLNVILQAQFKNYRSDKAVIKPK